MPYNIGGPKITGSDPGTRTKQIQLTIKGGSQTIEIYNDTNVGSNWEVLMIEPTSKPGWLTITPDHDELAGSARETITVGVDLTKLPKQRIVAPQPVILVFKWGSDRPDYADTLEVTLTP